MTVAKAEADNMVRSATFGPEPVSFGSNNARWLELLAQMQPGDELWQFVSSYDSWKHHAGAAGYELVRNGDPVASIITLQN